MDQFLGWIPSKKVTGCVLGVSWTCLWCSAWWQRTIKTTCNTWYENTKSSVRLCYGKLPLEYGSTVYVSLTWNEMYNGKFSIQFLGILGWCLCDQSVPVLAWLSKGLTHQWPARFDGTCIYKLLIRIVMFLRFLHLFVDLWARGCWENFGIL